MKSPYHPYSGGITWEVFSEEECLKKLDITEKRMIDIMTALNYSEGIKRLFDARTLSPIERMKVLEEVFIDVENVLDQKRSDKK
jgi:hypothetical protein